MTEQPEGPSLAEWATSSESSAPAHPPASEQEAPSAERRHVATAAAHEPQPTSQAPWSAEPPPVYPPSPEYYQQRAQAAPVFVTPGDPPGYEHRGLRDEPPRRPRWRRARYAHQPISELDVALLVLSAAVSFAVYALILGWQTGLGLTILLFVHEMGHFIVGRRKGLPTRLPIFVPLLGAFVLMGQASLSARDEAEIALAGPFAGGMGSVACLVAYTLTGQPVLLSIAFINLAINLFNLMPIGPLDGAHASRVISKWLMLPWLALMALAGLLTLDVLLTLLAGFAIWQVARRPSGAVITRYYASRKERRYVTLLYFGVIVTLIVASFFALVGVSGLRLLYGWLL